MARPARQNIVSGVEIENRFVASLWGLYLVQYCCVYKLSIEGDYFCVAQFSQMLWRIKTNFYRPTTIPVLQFYVKEHLWNETFREHRRAQSNRVWCVECFWHARRSRFESLRGGCGGQTVAWFYGCRRVMKTPQSQTKGPDQDDLIRGILKHSRRRRGHLHCKS